MSQKNRGRIRRCPLSRSYGLGGLALSLVLLWGCPPTLYINSSFRQASVVPIAAGMVSLSRGESIEVKAILKKEKVKPEKMLVTRLFGAYLLTAEGFTHVWRIAPSGREKGSYTKIKIPGGAKLSNPQFKHSESHNCVILVTGAQGAEKKWHIHPSGQVAGSCKDVSSN